MCNCSGGFRNTGFKNINPITRVKQSMQVAKQLWDSSKIEAKAVTITKIK